MGICENFIQKIATELPEKCTDRDLVRHGIYNSPQSAKYARSVGTSPPYFKFGSRVVYPKEGVVQWLRDQRYVNGKKVYNPQSQKKSAIVCSEGGLERYCGT